MKITGLEIDGYGIWTGLKLQGLSEGLNVLYGPNEAGKTTLLQFIRSALYGFSPARRRYFPPLRGGEPGGSIDLATPNGPFQLRRHDDQTGQAGNQERLALVAADGTLQGEHLVRTLLCEVDEAVYNNVFAVGLREIQQLGTLSDTEAAELLYRLTAGLDRVSLVEVTRELETSRNRILDAGGGPSQVTQLLEKREQLRLQIEELGRLTRRYGRLAAERNQLQREVTRLEEQHNQAQRQARVIELAVAVRDRWNRRTALDDELATLGPAATVPEGAVDRLDALNARLRRHQELAERVRQQREKLREEAAALAVNEALWRQAARIEALQEQQPWITRLRSQLGELEAEVAQIESHLATEQQQLGLGERTRPETLPVLSAGSLARLRPPARAIKQCRRRIGEAGKQAAAAGQTAESLSAELSAALAQRNQNDLATALDAAGNLTSQLRRRVQLDERLDQMALYQKELEEQSRRLLDRQLMPLWVLLGLGAVFVVGVVLVMAGLFMPTSITGSVGWAMALLGLAGSGAAGAGKVMFERSNTRQLEGCQKQINMLQLQLQEAKQERDALDRQLPSGGGPIGTRLQAAESELAALEELVPLDARRTSALQEAQAAAGRVARAEEDLSTAHHRWREALAAVGLPGSLTPKQVRSLVQRCGQITEMHRRLEDRHEELRRRGGELDSLQGRIAQLVSDSQTTVTGDDPIEQLRQLAEALKEQELRLQRRRELLREAHRLRRKRARHEEAVSRLKRRRRGLLRDADVEDEQQLRQRAVEAARAAVLRQQREALASEIAAAVAGTCSEDAIGRQLHDDSAPPLEARRGQLLQRLAALDQELKQRLEHRGRLAEQLKNLTENREMGQKRLELATVERRLEEAVGRWQVLAATSRILEMIRATYEKQRQPETLQEASGYLERLTQGRYRRVWTPLGEDVLRVDDAQGNSLPVEALSRGTREQLFLSLRLALAACYARRGAPLPLVLDDVLVNFDAARAKAAAAVLRDFAAAGHQVLVFTCHEHIFKLFGALKVPVGQLPDSAEADRAPVSLPQPPKKKTKRTKRAEPVPVKLAAEEEDEPPADEISPAEEEQLADADDGEPFEDDALWDDEEDVDVEDVEPDDEDAADETDEEEYDEEYDDEYDEEEDEYDEDDDCEWEEAEDEEDDEDYEDRGTAEAA